MKKKYLKNICPIVCSYKILSYICSVESNEAEDQNKKIMTAKEFKKIAKEMGREILKLRNSANGIHLTYAATIEGENISIPQVRFYRHGFNPHTTYDRIIQEWSL